ncbi:hypothetical protein R5R35_013614 [Gryllus longicercus]|uniref:Transcriptional coactivator p15 (PC4) C-terminal domain-containing protein n=1 Tax=Gryllus longicercus TaxID=2509291 RepID=A0AAN9Z7K0_9ORTH
MPKNKKDSSDSDSGPEDVAPSKKPKTASSSKADEEEPTWTIDKNRFLKIREFKGRIFVDIREFYESDGELKPGKKGISLTPTQWRKICDLADEVNDTLKKKA